MVKVDVMSYDNDDDDDANKKDCITLKCFSHPKKSCNSDIHKYALYECTL